MAAKRGETGEPNGRLERRRKSSTAATSRRKPATRSKRPVDDDAIEIERILDAASKLLTSKGLSAFNMNAVAALATVDLPTLHGHFRDKAAVLLALYEKTMAERTSAILGMMQQLQAGTEVETIFWLHQQLDKLVDMQLKDPAHVALRRAIRAVPELSAADEASNAAFSQVISAALVSLLPDIDKRRAQTVARAVVEAGTALTEYSAMHPKEARHMSREIGVMIVGYVREVLKST